MLANPGKQAKEEDTEAIECGVCHGVIYCIEGPFDSDAFLAARERHYLASPACKPIPS